MKKETVSQEVKNYVAQNIQDIATGHLECWKDRYCMYGGNKKRMKEDLYSNHDTSLEIEAAEDILTRELNQKEIDFLVLKFNKEVLKQWQNGF